jgi:hypothetical protein
MVEIGTKMEKEMIFGRGREAAFAAFCVGFGEACPKTGLI